MLAEAPYDEACFLLQRLHGRQQISVGETGIAVAGQQGGGVTTHGHRDLELVGQVDSQINVLTRQRCGEARGEPVAQDRPGSPFPYEATSAAGLDRLAQDVRVDACLYPNNRASVTPIMLMNASMLFTSFTTLPAPTSPQ